MEQLEDILASQKSPTWDTWRLAKVEDHQ